MQKDPLEASFGFHILKFALPKNSGKMLEPEWNKMNQPKIKVNLGETNPFQAQQTLANFLRNLPTALKSR